MKSISFKNITHIVCLTLLIITGLIIRLDDLSIWQAQPEKTFSGEQPLLATGDGYYYLSLARDIVDGTYQQVDDKRGIPESPEQPPIPPLLSILTGVISLTTGLSLNWIAVILPALLGVLLAAPLYGIGRILGGTPMALTAVGIGLFSSSYVVRSSLGKFDTDCLHVTLTLSAAYFFMRFAYEKGYKKYIFFSAGLLCWLFFVGWWDQAPHIASLISIWPLLIAVLFHYRPAVKEGVVFWSLTGVIVLSILSWFGFDLPLRIFNTFQSHLNYLLKKPINSFPSIGMLITEQQSYDLDTIIAITTNSSITFYIAMAGLVLLCYRQFNKMIFILMPLLLAALSVFYANRFLIFLGPVTALGLGFIAAETWQRYHRYKFVYLVPLFIIYAFWRALSSPIPFSITPFPPASIKGMQTVQAVTPENAVIWSWCDNGYPINYWADRATICDGQLHYGEISVYNTLPLASQDPKLAANFMNFFIHRGQNGIHTFYKAMDNDQGAALNKIKQIMAAGPEGARKIILAAQLQPVAGIRSNQDWLNYFFPLPERPLYIFIDYLQIQTSHWIAWFGSWDPIRQDGIHAINMKARHGVSIDGMEINELKGQLKGDLNRGVATYMKTEIPLSSAAITMDNRTTFYNYGKRLLKAPDILAASLNRDMQTQKQPFIQGSYHLEVSQHADTAILMGQEIAETIMHKLFWRGPAFQSPYFIPLLDRSPEYQLWEVRADRL
jgi:dolichyl-diphosphooligosaccharide--protein glycosyltransferase